MSKPDISRIITFQQLMNQFSSIQRMVRIPPENKVPEDDAQHSYTLAMVVWFLAPHFSHVDPDKAIRLALAHDLVEVHAGDTFAYGTQTELASKAEREAAALKQLQHEWQDFPDLIACIQEYEDLSTAEAKFVYALDKLMPAVMNYLGHGQVWREHGITFDKFMAEKEKKMTVSPDVYDYHLQLVELLKDHMDYFHDDSGTAV